MKNLKSRILVGMVLMVGGMSSMAATVNVTASFMPTMENPENDSFVNTTQQSGFCHQWPTYCSQGEFSIGLSIDTHITKSISAYNDPRDGPYFGLPGAMRTIKVTNSQSNQTKDVQFRIKLISAKAVYPTEKNMAAWTTNSFVNAPPPCGYAGVGVYGSTWYSFAWTVPNSNVACYKISNVDRAEPTKFTELSFGYELKTPNPLQMESGLYTGSLILGVGPGKDFDFGDNYAATDGEVIINFTLSVNHELQVTTPSGERDVSLQPCASGRTCTEDDGTANWERWMTTRVTPQLTGRSKFNLSSSGAFSVYLECEQQSGQDCALRSDNTPSQMVPVQSLLTLPDNVVDYSTNAIVSKRRLWVGRDLTKNVFVTKIYSQSKLGYIDFLVNQKDVDTMLKTRPDTYRGAITVIFDPKIY